MLDRLPPLIRALLVANALLFGMQVLLGEFAFLSYMLWPLGDHAVEFGRDAITVGFRPWQLVTYGFLHGDAMHLAVNMLMLFMFGAQIEVLWGSRRFGVYYFTCLVGAGLVQLAVATWALQQGQGPYPTIGASGGVFGVLLAFGLMFPNQRVMLLIPPIPMRAITLVVVLGALEMFLGVTGTRAGVAHFAHLGGMLFGFLLLQFWRGRWPFRPRRPR